VRPIPAKIQEKVGCSLHTIPGHPLSIVREMIYGHLSDFATWDDLSPIVTKKQNFDSLLIPEDHPSRSDSDTYYLDEDRLLRTHTSAHQAELLSRGYLRFLVTGPVFRRDEIDAKHYPVFHQMEGLGVDAEAYYKLPFVVEGLIGRLFPSLQRRKTISSFPFTDPSWEYEIFWRDQWIEILGCGIVRDEILDAAGCDGPLAWAFGLGLERIAMILFDIPDIRLFWSKDPRFLSQFEPGKITKFVPFSNQPPCIKDISFWTGPTFASSDFFALVRDEGNDLVESVTLANHYAHQGRESSLYRLVFRSSERTLTNLEINTIMSAIRDKAPGLDVTLR
jgi:phenylalanyl-tRNA synthetase alpha chain